MHAVADLDRTHSVNETNGDLVVQTPAYVRKDARGTLAEISNGAAWRSVLFGTMHAGAVVGNHYHRDTTVMVQLLSGRAVVRTVDIASGRRGEAVLSAGVGVVLKPGHSHVVRFVEPSTFLLLKSQAYDPAAPDTYPFPVE